MTYKICLDAGHGGYDVGAVGNGLKEKDLTLKVVTYLNTILLKDGRFATVLTRTSDTSPKGLTDTGAELKARSDISNEFGADLFISVHFNSFSSDTANGVEMLTFDNTGIAYTFAKTLCDIIGGQEHLNIRGVHDTHSTFSVIRSTKAPAVITESAFISNASDISHFDTDAELLELAWYHYVAICTAFGISALAELNPSYVAPKPTPAPSPAPSTQATDWRIDVGSKAVDKLQALGLMSNGADWKSKLLEPAPNWLVFELIRRLEEK